MELKSRVIKGFSWTAAEKIASGVFMIVVSIVVVNHIMPDDNMMVALLAAVVAILNTFVDSGFSQTLIRRLDAGDRDYSSVFFFNIIIAVGLYIVFSLFAPLLARIYNVPMLTTLAPVLFLLIPINSLCIIQQTILIKAFNFKRISTINFSSNIVGGIVAVALALAGTGAWALVGQRLATIIVKAAALWISSSWKPHIKDFSGKSIRSMYGFSSKLFVTDFINNTYNNIPTLFMGKLFQADLGCYNQAQKFKDLPVNASVLSVNSVTLPALANLSPEKYTLGLRQVTQMLFYIVCPIMVGLIATADDIFHLLIKSVWWPAIPLFQILCIAGIMTPVAMLFNNSMRARSNGNVIVEIEVLKKLIVTVILFITISISPTAIAWGQVGIAAVDLGMNLTANRKYSGYMWGQFIKDTLPMLAANILMLGAVVGIGIILPSACPVWLRLLTKIITGIVAYAAVSALFRLPSWKQTIEIVRNYFKSRKA